MRSTHQRLRTTERLERKNEFERVYREGKRCSGRFFIAYVCSSQHGALRLGVVASRKVGGAVARNRAKRWLREAFRKNRPQKPVSADVVLIARATISEARFTDVEKAYVRIVCRAIEETGN